MKKNNEKQQWPTGMLCEEVITADLRRGTLPKALVLTAAAMALGVIAWPVLMVSTDMTLRAVALLVGTGILAVMAYKQWHDVLTKLEYKIEEDRILSKQMQISYEDKAAEATDLQTRVPMLELENYGPYRISAEQINRDFQEYELFHILEEGEEVYLIREKKNNKLLHIYRKKYWTLP